MKIEFSHHVIERLHQRGIPLNDIIQTIKFPDWYEEAKGGKIMCNKVINEASLTVIYAITKSGIEIIAAYY
ncbi:MAG: DUF4258 domain-containing protein [Candidatus Pacebacteria bacterium]|nr:DUF4258 domain-containing protein [Candidatus Paceibacterota bacterium]